MTWEELAVSAWEKMSARQRDIACNGSLFTTDERIHRACPRLTREECQAVAQWVIMGRYLAAGVE